MSENVDIRLANVDDAAGMVAILNPIIQARIYTAIDTPATLESQRDWIESFPERGVFHVAEERETGRLVGMQDVVPFFDHGTTSFHHVGVIATFVSLDRHRRGIGARLFAAMFEAARAKGFEKICANVRADNEAGLRAYTGQGFVEIGRALRHCKVDGRYIDEVLTERFL